MNPAALKANLADLPKGGTLIVNKDEFTESNLKKALYAANPLEDGSLAGWRVIEAPVTSMNPARSRTAASTPSRWTAPRTSSRWA